MRPVDTENIINNRQQIRLFSGLKFVLCFVYLSISPLFTQVQASWVHLYHLFIEPLAILASVTENQLFMTSFMYLNTAATFVDGLIGFLNLISISRCFGEPTASCFDRLYENSVWFLLAALFIFFNLMCVMQFRNLSSQMLEKDETEEERVRLASVRGIAPSYNSIKIAGAKLETLHLFLIPSDVIFTIIILFETASTPIYWLGVGHVFIDPYVFFSGKSLTKGNYEFMRIVYIVLFIADIIILILNTEVNDHNFGQSLAFIMLLVYVSLDIVMFMFATEIIGIFDKMRKDKSNL